MKTFIFFLMLTSWAHAFTLNNNFGAAFKSNRVNVSIANDTTCSNAGMTIYELEDLVKPAINRFWNEVPTSALRLSANGFSDPIGNNINLDRLCAPTDTTCINAAAAASENVIPPVSDIVIACNGNASNYGGSGGGVLAVTVPNNFNGRKITGAVILINNMASSSFSALTQSDKISVIAHEIGHAIGLGHAEENSKESLMYYKMVDLRKNLSQDDVDGVSYLYPVKYGDGCGLFSSTIDTNVKGPPFWQMGLSFFALMLLAEMLKLFKRSKARSPA